MKKRFAAGNTMMMEMCMCWGMCMRFDAPFSDLLSITNPVFSA